VKQEPIETSAVKSEEPDKIDQMVMRIQKKNLLLSEESSVTDVKQESSKAVKKETNLGFLGTKKKNADDKSMCSEESGGASAVDQNETEREQENLRKQADMQELLNSQHKKSKSKKTTIKSKILASNKTPKGFYYAPTSAQDIPVSRQLQQVKPFTNDFDQEEFGGEPPAVTAEDL
jgi:hypothetical protein